MMIRILSRLLIISILISSVWNESVAQSANDLNRHGKLRVSANHHFLEYEDGSPFFWLGDTGWELFHRLNKEGVEKYFATRSNQGFTVIQAVVLAEFDGLHTPNAYGELPLLNDDPLQPGEAYFKYVDWVIDKAADYGLQIALLPTWGDKIYKNNWGTGPEIFDSTNARSYGEWIGKRYKDRKNIIWVMGGDRSPRGPADVAIWNAMANGIVSGTGGYDHALVTFHPQPSATCSSSPWFHKNDWLDFNMLQTGHCNDAEVWRFIGSDYSLMPAKPVLDGEAVYEDHPLCFNAREKGYTQAYDIRKAAYLSIFGGGFGFTYGCHAIWQFYSPDRQPVNNPLRFWYVSLDLPGARQMKYLKTLLESFPLNERVPDQHILLDTLQDTHRIQATRGRDYLLIYAAGGDAFRVRMGIIKGSTLKAWWYDPRTGAKIYLRKIANQGTHKFMPLSAGYDNDWVLVLSDASKHYFEN
jgi:hypothetical protein